LSPLGKLLLGAIVGTVLGVILSRVAGFGMPIFSILLAPVGAFLGCSLPPSSAFRKSRTVYALIDRRVFVICDLYRNRQMKSLPLQFIRGISLTEHVLGRGSILFSAQGAHLPSANVPYIRFFMIGDAKRVHDLLVDAKSDLADRTE
jgi:hypothetical protein